MRRDQVPLCLLALAIVTLALATALDGGDGSDGVADGDGHAGRGRLRRREPSQRQARDQDRPQGRHQSPQAHLHPLRRAGRVRNRDARDAPPLLAERAPTSASTSATSPTTRGSETTITHNTAPTPSSTVTALLRAVRLERVRLGGRHAARPGQRARELRGDEHRHQRGEVLQPRARSEENASARRRVRADPHSAGQHVAVRRSPASRTSAARSRGTAGRGRERRRSATRTSGAAATRTGNACSDITGATAPTYAVTSDDLGSTLRFQVTATNGQGSSQADVRRRPRP